MDVVTPEEQQERDALYARMTAPLTQQDTEAAQAAMAQAGVTNVLWSQLHEDSARGAATQLRNFGTLPTSLVLTTPFDTKSPDVRVKEEIAHLYRSATMFRRTLLLVVDAADDWWPMERVLVCNTHELIYISCIYTAIKRTGDQTLLRYMPKGKGAPRTPGRPRSEEVALRKQGEAEYKERYFAWQAECRDIRAQRVEVEEEYARVKEHLQQLKHRMQELDAQIPPMPRKQ